MAQPALFHESLEARLFTGRVLAAAGTTCQVLAGDALCDASLAASCLMVPQVNDTVLLACLEDGTDVVLSILVRDTGQPSRVSLPHDTTLECPGNLTIRAASTLELQSAKTLRLGSDDLAVTARTATATAVQVSTVCDTAKLCCQSLTTLGQTAISVFRSVTQCFGASQKLVHGTDTTQCANATLVAQETATVMSKNSLSLAQETARTDAKLIQLG